MTKGKIIYMCKTLGCLGGARVCSRIAEESNKCKAHGNFKCKHKVKSNELA